MEEDRRNEDVVNPGEPSIIEEESPEEFVPSAEELEDLEDNDGDASVAEPFEPTDFFEPQPKHKRKRHGKRRRKRAVWLSLIAAGVLLLALTGVYAFRVVYNPSSLFSVDAQSAATPSPGAAQQQLNLSATPSPTPSPSPTPLSDYDALALSADQTMMQNIVNVMLIGVDYADERETWNGKHDYHADVMMVLAVNFDENRVDLISLPRDTYANIPGVKGIYKLNGSINCGGGLDAPNGAGFLKTCEAASWMLGGIPVNYYYAVTMPAVKQLVDVVGGVDYDLEMSFKMAGRSYKKGQQHMDGQAVLDYLRVRKNVNESGDLNRVNRQKQMLVALFDSMQQQSLITKIPQIVSTFNGQLFTNCSAGQTAALATFAYGLNKENIGMYSMGGTMKNIFNWNFCITDQSKRVQIIQTVYGMEVPEERAYGMDYAKYRWAAMRAERYLTVCKPLTKFLDAAIAADDLLPVAPEILPGDNGAFEEVIPPEGDIGDTPVVDGGATIMRMSARFTPVESEIYQQYNAYARGVYSSNRAAINSLADELETANAKAKQYVAGERDSLSGAATSLSAVVDDVYNYGTTAASLFGYGGVGWSVSYENDTDFNEVYVDFR